MASHRADERAFLDDRGYSGHLVRGQAPYLLIEEGVRDRIINSLYFKEQCFGLNAASLCDRAVELNYVGGTYDAGRRPSPFLCLAFKMLQLDIEDEIIDIYLREGGEDWKYMRALAVFYIRITGEKSEEVYKRLEPFLTDKRKLRRRNNNGFNLTFVDEFVDDLLVKDRVCATSLWKLVPRNQLEDEDKLDPYVSPVQHLLESDNEESERERSSQAGSPPPNAPNGVISNRADSSSISDD